MDKAGISRKNFLQGALASMGVGYLGGRRLFAAPAGWTPPSGTPDLVFGVISDSHIGKYPGPAKEILKNALRYFKSKGVHAVMNCGDDTKWGQVWELAYFRDAWNEVFPSNAPVKLFVTGNHEYYGGDTAGDKANGSAWFYGDDNPETRDSSVVKWVSDYIDPGYEEGWHKTVAGRSGRLYHFFGYGGPENKDWDKFPGDKDVQDRLGEKTAGLILAARSSSGWDEGMPFFVMSHIQPSNAVNKSVATAIGCTVPEICNKGLWFYGHGHANESGWGKSIQFPASSCIPQVQCGTCGCKGSGGEGDNPVFAEGFGDGKAEGAWCPPMGTDTIDNGFLVSVYSEAIVIHRVDLRMGVEGTELASLGPDWIMSLGSTSREEHPFSREVMRTVIGEPQFRSGAKLGVAWEAEDVVLTIPKADGNSDSRIYGYNVEVTGLGQFAALRKSVYATGYSHLQGYEPNDGVTVFRIAKRELPEGERLVFRVWPCSSLGTRGDPITKSAACIRVSLEKSVSGVSRGTRFVLTDGAGIPDGTGVVADKLPWVKCVCVEDGEIVVYTREPVGASVRIK